MDFSKHDRPLPDNFVRVATQEDLEREHWVLKVMTRRLGHLIRTSDGEVLERMRGMYRRRLASAFRLPLPERGSYRIALHSDNWITGEEYWIVVKVED